MTYSYVHSVSVVKKQGKEHEKDGKKKKKLTMILILSHVNPTF